MDDIPTTKGKSVQTELLLHPADSFTSELFLAPAEGAPETTLPPQ